MERFTTRIKDLRNEIISAIVEVMNNANVTTFEFNDEIDYCERVWQTCCDKNGELCDCYVTKVELDDDDNNLIICSESAYGLPFKTRTIIDYEAKQVDFLNDLYQNIVYYLTKK